MMKLRLLIILVFFIIPSISLTAQETGSIPPNQVKTIVQKSFGLTMPIATQCTPLTLEGDFNGDGAKDLLVTVHPKVKVKDLPEDVIILNLWTYGQNWTFNPSTDLSKGAKIALAIIHGTKTEAFNATTTSYLLYDDHPISILDTYAARNLTVVEQEKQSQLIHQFPDKVTGDIIILPTEAGIDTYIYWNGRTYKFLEPHEEP